ncbi:hypothetical protein CYMTET_4114 [Cymbomonas tetramitiformis]|uniref:Exportin-T n=1 Tax=Cymbomonas tetramitiformis TaxID=36881 RepID=A0AAE0H204_9CHLO|nr:hypothetical protein CYMTET_4114 [Cymbomonas tetramitiformis]
MADDIEKAILFSFDQTGAVDPSLKEQALAYLENLKALPNCWQLCLERFSPSSHAEVKFWCLQTLLEVLKAQPSHFPAESSQQVNGALMLWLSDDCVREPSLPSFLKNKIVQIIVTVLKRDYPEKWPTFFQEFISHLGKGVGASDMFCRILQTLDEEMFSLPLSPEESVVSMRIKDGMRELCVPQMVEAIHSLVIHYQAEAPQSAGMLLETLASYIIWIDINLIANEKMLPLLVGALTAPSSWVREGGIACISALVAKRMDFATKLVQLQQLQLVPLCVQLCAAQEDDDAVMVRVTGLLVALAQELLSCITKSERDCASPTKAGEMPGPQLSPLDRAALVESAKPMLDQLLPPLLERLGHANPQISTAVPPFLTAYVARAKRLATAPSQLPPDVVQVLSQMLVAIAQRCRFPQEGHSFIAADNPQVAEQEEEVREFRADLFTTFRNISKFAPNECHKLVGVMLSQAVVAPEDAPFQDMEVALALLYEMGEGSEEVTKPAAGALGELLGIVLSRERVAAASHRLVTLGVMEVVVRYVRFLQQHPAAIAPALATFLDDRGLRHPQQVVSSRACYLFMRLVKSLRPQLGPHMPSLLSSLAQALPVILSMPAAVVRKAQGVTADDRLYAFEAAGLLISSDELAEDEQHAYLSAYLASLQQKIESVVAACPPGDQMGSSDTTDQIQRTILAVSHISKGFTSNQINVQRPRLGDVLQGVLETILQVLYRLPLNRPLRARITSFLHRMLECLGERVFHHLPRVVHHMLQSAEIADTTAMLQLINQLVKHYKVAAHSLLLEVLEPLVARVFTFFQIQSVPNHELQNTEEVREANDLKLAYYLLLNGIVASGLLPALCAPVLQPRLESILAGLVQDASHHPMLQVRKSGVSTLRLLLGAGVWGAGVVVPNGAEPVPGWHQFVLLKIGGECAVRSVLAGTLDLRDAFGMMLLGEFVALQRAVYTTCGDSFLEHVVQVELPLLGYPAAVGPQYAQHVCSGDDKQLKAFVREMIAQRPKPQ